ncbi:MAG: hypothetical protein K2L48_04260 [Mycoplasmoidaceae bacterium]|nr:hypothetical protein [Mycoplasmoidaceae bacterium]
MLELGKNTENNLKLELSRSYVPCGVVDFICIEFDLSNVSNSNSRTRLSLYMLVLKQKSLKFNSTF